MASIPLPLNSGGIIAVLPLVLVGAALAQAPKPQSSDQPELPQPTQSSVQQQESHQTEADRGRAEADRKVREMDRRLARTLRSVCVGC